MTFHTLNRPRKSANVCRSVSDIIMNVICACMSAHVFGMYLCMHLHMHVCNCVSIYVLHSSLFIESIGLVINEGVIMCRVSNHPKDMGSLKPMVKLLTTINKLDDLGGSLFGAFPK